MEQKLLREIRKYRIVVVDNYTGTCEPLPGLHDSWSAAQDALKEYFDKHPRKSGTEYDIGGYIERVKLKAAYNPTTGDYFENDEEEF